MAKWNRSRDFGLGHDRLERELMRGLSLNRIAGICCAVVFGMYSVLGFGTRTP
jgi:hypothetical protein